jgi:hypothetical protein
MSQWRKQPARKKNALAVGPEELEAKTSPTCLEGVISAAIVLNDADEEDVVYSLKEDRERSLVRKDRVCWINVRSGG